jgi:hypothetical protein
LAKRLAVWLQGSLVRAAADSDAGVHLRYFLLPIDHAAAAAEKVEGDAERPRGDKITTSGGLRQDDHQPQDGAVTARAAGTI